MKRITKIALVLALAIVAMSATGCMKPYDKPEFVEVQPNETAVVIPLEGETSAQGKTPNADFYSKNLNYAKRIPVPHKWVKEGRMADSGRYVPTVKVIVTNNSPYAREWTDTADTGTSAKNQAIVAESKESIGFKARMTTTAQVRTEDVPKFLSWYHGKPMDEILDTDLRNYIGGELTAECAKRELDDIRVNKEAIMSIVRNKTVDEFAKRGITITSLNLTGEFTYLNPKIQTVIDDVFAAAREKEAQELRNSKNIAEAKAKATAGKMLASGVGLELKKLELRDKALDNQAAAIAKWNGEAPKAVGSSSFLNIPLQ